MNNFSQNELLSAYLDGELTAAEQAEIERLLATSPAARQLLDELRTLSSTLQSLPQEKLGEDLSRHVLRVAERRMLTEGGPGDDRAAPMPLVRSVFRRFLTRRTVVWLSLTTAIAVMIVVNERWEGARPVQIARQMSPPLSADNQVVRRSGPPPTIQAAHDRDDKSQKEILTVHCRISPEAANGQAFEKLLDANGVAWHVQRGGAYAADRLKAKAAEESKPPPKAESLPRSSGMQKGNLAGPATPSIAGGTSSSPSSMVGQAGRSVASARAVEKVIVVDASAAQIEAILASLTAQPKAFLSFAVNPTHGETMPGGDDYFQYTQRVQVAGSEMGRGAAGQLDTVVREGKQQPSKADEPRQAVEGHEQQRQAGTQVQSQLAQPMSHKRVLFVLHVADGDDKPVAAKAGSQVEADTAKPAEQPVPPATAPK